MLSFKEEVSKINHGWNLFVFQVMMMKDKKFMEVALKHYDKAVAKIVSKKLKESDLLQ